MIDVSYFYLNNYYLSGNATDTVFAYQGFAGLRYAVSDKLGLSIEYRYLHSDSPSFQVDYGYYVYGPSDQIKFGPTETHSFSIALECRF